MLPVRAGQVRQSLARSAFYGRTIFMPKSNEVPKRKRGRPYSGGRDPLVNTRIPIAMIEALEQFAADEKPPISRSEAVRRLLGEHLRKHGYLGKD